MGLSLDSSGSSFPIRKKLGNYQWLKKGKEGKLVEYSKIVQ